MDAERDRSVASSVALCRLADRPEKHAAGPRVGLKLNRVAACLLPILILPVRMAGGLSDRFKFNIYTGSTSKQQQA